MKIFQLLILCFIVSGIAKGQNVSAKFTDLTGVTFNGSTKTLTKTGADSWTNGAAFSENELAPGTDGEVEYVVADNDQTKAFGITSIKSSSLGLTTIEHAFYVSRGSLYITNNGKVIKRLGRILNGTNLKVRVKSGEVYFEMSNRIIYRTGMSSTVINYVGAVIYDAGGTFENIKTSFPPPPPPPLEDTIIQHTELQDLPTEFVKIIGNQFYFSFDYRLMSSSDELRFYVWNKFHEDRSEEVIISETSLTNGHNEHSLNLTSLEPGIFTLEVVLPNGDKLYAKFNKTLLAGEEVDFENETNTN